MKKRIIALLLAMSMLLSVASVLTACNDDEGEGEGSGETPGGEGEGTEGEGAGTGGNGGNEGDGSGSGNGSGGENTPQTVTYSLSLKNIGGKPFDGVGYLVYTDSTMTLPVTAGSFSADGTASFSAAASDNYVVTLIGVPKGYSVGSYYPVSRNTSIVLTPSVISDTDLSGVSYKVGDIMRDFTLTDIDGNVHTLSEILKNKDMVMLNFWYSSCNPCRMEFPHMESAYSTPFSEESDAAHKDNIEILAICPSTQGDSLLDVQAFRDEFGLTFPVLFYEETALLNAFSITGYPTSVFIDRYGTICAIQTGAVTDQRAFPAAFAHFSSDNYEQKLLTFIEDLIPVEYPDVEMPESSEIEAVLNGENEVTEEAGDKMGATYAPETEPGVAELVWPFLIGNKDGYDCIYASNSGKVASYAMIYSYVELKAGEALAIDYYASTEYGCDYLYVIVNGKDVAAISGDSSDEGWTTFYPYVAIEDGTYEVVFAYIKDESTDFGEDTVYLKDYRIVSEENIERKTHIPRYAATDVSANGVTYNKYVTIVYNAKDGYYHVGDENGPLLLVNLLGKTNFNSSSIQMLVTDNKILLNGVDIYDTVIKYCNYASNATMPGYCPVTAELYECLKAVAENVGLGIIYGATAEQDVLTMCEYYDAYGPGRVQLEDPIKGLANFSAYDVIENERGDKTLFPNKFKFDRMIMPRGLRAKFTPAASGVYLIMTKSDYETDAWIFLEDGSQYLCYSNNERHATDYQNCYVIAYLEAGVDYYINIAFYDVTQYGDVYYNVCWVGEDGYEDAEGNYYRFGRASDTAYTYDPEDYRCPTCDTRLENITSANPETGTGKGTCATCDKEATGSLSYELIDGGIKVTYDADTDRYYEVLTDGSLGGMLYADFWMDMGVFGTGQNLMFVLENGGFDFSKREDGSVIPGGVDYTDRVREIIAELLIDMDNDGKMNGVEDGCVPVTRELAQILQKLMDKYTFKIETPGDDYELGSWKKLCYRYEYFGEKNKPVPRVFEE